MEQYELVETFKEFLESAMHYADQAHESLFSKNTNISIALAYLNAAVSHFSAAEALYYAQYDVLNRAEAEDIFYQFKVYSKEFFTNVATDHSHQWTDIEFNRLKDIFESSALSSN